MITNIIWHSSSEFFSAIIADDRQDVQHIPLGMYT